MSASGAKSLGDRLGPDAFDIEAATVVGNLNDDVTAFMAGGEPDHAPFWLAGGAAFRRRLEAVIGGVAHHVRQRVLDEIEHLAVEFGVGPEHLELDGLAEFGR